MSEISALCCTRLGLPSHNVDAAAMEVDDDGVAIRQVKAPSWSAILKGHV